MEPMTPQDVEAAFRKVRDTFAEEIRLRPGSTQLSREQINERIQKVVDSSLEAEWRDIYETFTVNGDVRTVHPISALALALERGVGIIRRWESRGYLPKAPFRRLNDSPRGRHRFYTTAHIEGLENIALEEGLLRRSKNRKVQISATQFPARAHELFQRLKQDQTP
jgi:hypothetical protein